MHIGDTFTSTIVDMNLHQRHALNSVLNTRKPVLQKYVATHTSKQC